MSKLCVEICKIDDILEHTNADSLEIAVVKGWNCIIKKNSYKIGDLITFIPPDSVLPDDLIQKYNLEYLKKNGRTGTLKLRGFISQGLILPVPVGNHKEGDDVAKVLGITKYEQPEPSYSGTNTNKKSTKKKVNPLFDKYTDMNNIKHYNGVFKEGDLVVIREKIHGSNARYSMLPITKGVGIIDKVKYFINKHIKKNDYEFLVGSHNVQITHHTRRNSFYGDDVWSKVAKKYDLENLIPKDHIVYGEVYGQENGTKIQDLTYGKDEFTFAVFDVKHNGKYLSHNELERFCSERNLPTAPILYVGHWYDGLIPEFTKGESVICPSQIREGFVVKSYDEVNDLHIGRKILKSISEDYLLRKNATEFK